MVEIKTTAALQHPHVLPLFDSGEADGFLYYVMPFSDGETLRANLDPEAQSWRACWWCRRRAADPALASAASLATDALSRVLGTMRYAQVTIASGAAAVSDVDRRAEAAAGRMATILDGRLNTTGDSLQFDLRLTEAATGGLRRDPASVAAVGVVG